MKEVKLKPCPFCGSDGLNLKLCGHRPDGFWIQCEECGTEGPYCNYIKDAKKYWNRRAVEVKP